MELPNVEPLMKKVGVQWQVVKSAEHKDIGSPFREMTESDRQLLSAMVQDVYQQFVEVVSKERKISVDKLLPLADGRVLSGRQALQTQLIDRVGNFNDAVAAAGRMAHLGRTPKLVYPAEKKPTWLDVLFGRAATSAMTSLMRPLEDAVSTPRVKFQVPL
jgi:protease-4